MANDDRQQERRRNRGRKGSNVIEAKAVDVTPVAVETAASHVEPTVAPIQDPPPPVEPQPTVDVSISPPPSEAKAEPAPEPIREPPPPHPDLIPPPPAPPAKPRYAAPLAAAGLVGALFGATGGLLAPSLFGGSGPTKPTGETERLQRLEQGLTALQSRPVPAGPGSSAAESAQLVQRIAALEAELARRIAAQEQQIDQRIASRIAALPAPAPATAPAPQVDIAPLTGRLDGVEKALADLDRRSQSAVDAARATAVEAGKVAVEGLKAVEPKLTDLAAVLARTTQRVETTAAAPLFGAAQALGQAFNRGAPFALELSALEALGAKPEHIQSLKALAEKGAPTAGQIAEAFRPLAMAAARAGQPAASGVQAIVDSLVRTRAAGPGAADTPDGVVSAIENALKSGDVAAALAAWSKLPEASRAATEAWAATARQREAARQAIRTIEEQALAALRKTTP